ncbi:MAG: hypothetical protein ACRCT8_12215, partial [Lacipirellulaceae bacterium]
MQVKRVNGIVSVQLTRTEARTVEQAGFVVQTLSVNTVGALSDQHKQTAADLRMLLTLHAQEHLDLATGRVKQSPAREAL